MPLESITREKSCIEIQFLVFLFCLLNKNNNNKKNNNNNNKAKTFTKFFKKRESIT